MTPLALSAVDAQIDARIQRSGSPAATMSWTIRADAWTNTGLAFFCGGETLSAVVPGRSFRPSCIR